MDWQTEPHTVDPVIAVAVEHVESLLQPSLSQPVAKVAGTKLASARQNYAGVGIQLTPILDSRDCELAGFNLVDVIAAYRMEAR